MSRPRLPSGALCSVCVLRSHPCALGAGTSCCSVARRRGCCLRLRAARAARIAPWLAAAVPNPIWKEAGDALGTPLQPSVSIARNQPWFELGRPLVCMLAIGCGFLVGSDRKRARQLLKVIAWSGAAYAAYGILRTCSIRPTSCGATKRRIWRRSPGPSSTAIRPGCISVPARLSGRSLGARAAADAGWTNRVACDARATVRGHAEKGHLRSPCCFCASRRCS